MVAVEDELRLRRKGRDGSMYVGKNEGGVKSAVLNGMLYSFDFLRGEE